VQLDQPEQLGLLDQLVAQSLYQRISDLAVQVQLVFPPQLLRSRFQLELVLQQELEQLGLLEKLERPEQLGLLAVQRLLLQLGIGLGTQQVLAQLEGQMG